MLLSSDRWAVFGVYVTACLGTHKSRPMKLTGGMGTPGLFACIYADTGS